MVKLLDDSEGLALFPGDGASISFRTKRSYKKFVLGGYLVQNFELLEIVGRLNGDLSLAKINALKDGVDGFFADADAVAGDEAFTPCVTPGVAIILDLAEANRSIESRVVAGVEDFFTDYVRISLASEVDAKGVCFVLVAIVVLAWGWTVMATSMRLQISSYFVSGITSVR